MRFIRSFAALALMALAALTPAFADPDPTDLVRQYIAGSWQTPGTGADGHPTRRTVTFHYDGTRTGLVEDVSNLTAPVKLSETADFYRVDWTAKGAFKLSVWSDPANVQTFDVTRLGDDTMGPTNTELVYTRVPGSAEPLPAPLPPQRAVGDTAAPSTPIAAAPPADPVPAACPPTATAAPAESPEEKLRAFFVGRWTASLTQQGVTFTTTMDFDLGGGANGVQIATKSNQTSRIDLAGAYAVQPISNTSFRLAIFIANQPPTVAVLDIVDHDTLHNRELGYTSKREK